MLNILRNQKVQKRIFIVLAIAIIASFGVSGLLITHDNQQSGSSIGKIHGKSITVQDYLASYKAVDHQARMMYGQALDQIRAYINFKGEAWDRLLLLNYAKKHGIKASDQDVVNWIGSQSFLQNRGQFDERLYKMFVSEYLHEDTRRFEEEVRDTLTIGKIRDKIEAGIPISDEELKQFYAQKNGQRQIEYFVLSLEADKEKAAISDEELKKIYPLYQNNLQEPSKAKIRYAIIHKGEETKFKDALADNDSSLDTLALKYNLKISESLYFSRNEAIPGIGLIQALIEKSFTLGPRESSEWIALEEGNYKIELLDKKPSKILSFEESKDKLREILLHQKSVELSLQKMNELTQNLNAADFEKFAESQKLDLKTMDDFKKGSYVPGIGPSDSIENALGAVKEGQISRPIPVPNGAALVKVLKNSVIDEKKFVDEKEKYRKEARQEKAQKEMEKLLESLRKDLVPNLTLLKQIFPEEEKTKP